jgi:hypothetical protein
MNNFSGNISISGVFTSGSVRASIANNYAGGLVGYVNMRGQSKGASITNSYSVASVQNNTIGPGGLIGNYTGVVSENVTLSNVYSAGTLTVVDTLRSRYGLVGNMTNGTHKPVIINSFWDTDITGALAVAPFTIAGSTAKSTSEMKSLTTFSAWPIVEGWEAFNFSTPANFWGICSAVNDGYPFLLWEYSTDPCLSAASAPSITSISPASSSGTLSVAFTAPTSDGGAVISNYKYSLDNGATWVTRSPSATTSPLVIQGLNNGTSYQIKLLAINSVGEGAASTAVSGTPLTSASAPTITAITASSGALSVAFTAPTLNGGAPISNYKYSLDNGATWITRSPASTSSPLAITGLTNGTSYQLKLLAINSQGDGAASSAVSGTPVAPSPTTSASPAATPAPLTTPAATLAVTGSNLLGNWGFVVATFFVGLALVLISGARRREPHQGKG